MTHTGHSRYEMEKDDKGDIVPSLYETVHLHVAPPPELQPITPKQLLKQTSVKVKEDRARRAASALSSPFTSPRNSRAPSPARGGLRSMDVSPSLSPHSHKPLKSALSKRSKAPIAAAFRTLVSFDTVNLGFSDEARSDHSSSLGGGRGDSTSILLDDEFGFNSDRRASGTQDWRSPSPLSGDRSPRNTRDLSPAVDIATSPARTASASSRSRSRRRRDSSYLRKYPTTPIITHDACTLTRKHRLFDRLYSGSIKPRAAVLPNRNILCYVSGRKHTWVSIDWCCNQLLEDGDTLVIIASIRPNWRGSLRRRLSSGSAFAYSGSQMTEENIRRSPEYARVVTENLMKYVMAILNSNRIIKVTVELSVGSTKDVMKDMYSLYMPSVVVTSAKPTAAPSTKSWLTSRITDRLVKNFPVPVIIVPATNMDLFQRKLFKVLDRRMRLAADGRGDTQELLEELQDAGVYNLEDQLDHLKENATDDVLIENDLKEFAEGQREEDEEEDEEDAEDVEEAEEEEEDEEEEDEEEQSEADNSFSVDFFDGKDARKNRHRRGSLNDDVESNDSGSHPLHRPSLVRYKTENIGAQPHMSGKDDSKSLSSQKSASFQLKQLELDTHIRIYKEMCGIQRQPVTEDTFKHFLGVVSDVAYNYGVQLAECAKKGGEEANLVRTMTGAPDVAYMRPKSMLLSSHSGAGAHDGSAIHNARMKKSDTSPAATGRMMSTPTIKVDSPDTRNNAGIRVVSSFSDASSKPRTSSLRFNLGTGVSKSPTNGLSPSPSRSIQSVRSNPTPGSKERGERKGFFKRFFGKS
ncbi:DEKNAAC105405 [Brettanomyces naardenensis]|uniref:DEKNAAC105405 n=1 Tax=Brettanomyces naardenensis TaxID=13370 RepID=A0A448YTH6_BRENA|nr:DEKNAAC105405 [Brettanomyces naardenensis]